MALKDSIIVVKEETNDETNDRALSYSISDKKAINRNPSGESKDKNNQNDRAEGEEIMKKTKASMGLMDKSSGDKCTTNPGHGRSKSLDFFNGTTSNNKSAAVRLARERWKANKKKKSSHNNEKENPESLNVKFSSSTDTTTSIFSSSSGRSKIITQSDHGCNIGIISSSSCTSPVHEAREAWKSYRYAQKKQTNNSDEKAEDDADGTLLNTTLSQNTRNALRSQHDPPQNTTMNNEITAVAEEDDTTTSLNNVRTTEFIVDSSMTVNRPPSEMMTHEVNVKSKEFIAKAVLVTGRGGNCVVTESDRELMKVEIREDILRDIGPISAAEVVTDREVISRSNISNHRNSKKRVIYLALCFAIAILIAIMCIIMTRHFVTRNTSLDEIEESSIFTSPVLNDTKNGTEVQIVENTIKESSITFHPIEGGSQQQLPAEEVAVTVTLSFVSRTDLIDAIDSYIAGTFVGPSIETWDVSQIKGFNQLFDAERNSGASRFNANISQWDTSSAVTMRKMFNNANSFNRDISDWDVSKVTRMDHMFSNAGAFNQNLSNWDVSSVKIMQGMFHGAYLFNQDISAWDTSQVITMKSLFKGAFSFNHNISTWDVSQVENMESMFEDAHAFNIDLSSWDTSKVTKTMNMFHNALAFNQNISKWKMSKVTNIRSMFQGAIAFNSDISTWDTSSVTDMSQTFQNAISFNQDISSWDTSKVRNFRGAFSGAIAFNSPIMGWRTGRVIDMSIMFYKANNFNQDISLWNVQSVQEMDNMFREASNFNQDISSWRIFRVSTMIGMFRAATSFNQNLCLWGSTLSPSTRVRDMFNQTMCPNQSAPNLRISPPGPFCHAC